MFSLADLKGKIAVFLDWSQIDYQQFLHKH